MSSLLKQLAEAKSLLQSASQLPKAEDFEFVGISPQRSIYHDNEEDDDAMGDDDNDDDNDDDDDDDDYVKPATKRRRQNVQTEPSAAIVPPTTQIPSTQTQTGPSPPLSMTSTHQSGELNQTTAGLAGRDTGHGGDTGKKKKT